MDPLVSTQWLAERLGTADLVVLDATKYLPNEPKDGRAEYLRARVPGARFFDIDEIADPDTDLPHMVPSPGRFARLVGALGIGPDSICVFYDQKGLASAARGWWMMGLFGHDRAAVLDGGLPKWLAEGRPVEAGPPAEVAPAAFRADFRSTWLRGIGDMLALSPGGQAVLDARPAGRFAGTAPEPRPGMPSGHMPGSTSLPASTLLAEDGTMLPPEALRGLLAGAGADGTRPVITTCGTGVTATILTLALARAGLPQGAVYDGSWTEWGGRPDTPKERS